MSTRYDLPHLAGWDPYTLRGLFGQVSWVGSALCRSRTASHKGKLGSAADDLPDVSVDR